MLTISLGSAALAEVKKIAEVSWWSVFKGTREDGTPFCAMVSRAPYGSGNIVIEYFKGAPSYGIVLNKPTWAIPDGTRGSVVVRFGYGQAWTIATAGSGAKIGGEISMHNIDAFMSGFQSSGRIDVTFTAGNEPPWEFATGGGGIVESDFENCILSQNPQATPTNATLLTGHADVPLRDDHPTPFRSF